MAHIPVKVSAKHARSPFNGCDPAFIREVCKAACCRSRTAPGGVLVAVAPAQAGIIAAHGGAVSGGLLSPRCGRCAFQHGETHLCQAHGTPAKPWGCIASPFTVNHRDTLIVRNRYRLLKCFKAGRMLPAYVAFRASLDLLFGTDEAARISAHLDGGGGDLAAGMRAPMHAMLRHSAAVHGAAKPC